MCGIAGLFSNELKPKVWFNALINASNELSKRGPDAGNIIYFDHGALAHRRLSIIDTSETANQPMLDSTKRYSIIFNGEIFNYRELKADLIKKGISFFTESDTEVLLQLFITEKENFLNKLNGFFALAIYDAVENKMFVARDRYGVKPLYYFSDNNTFAFASEMKAMNCFPIKKEIDKTALTQYFQLNYIQQPRTIFKHIKQLMPGHYLLIDRHGVTDKIFYKIPFKKETETDKINYASAQKKLEELLEASVQRRLISDVPLGAFLSGGIDSSVVVALAARHTTNLKTFSIGFRDEPFFDETKYAKLVADKFKTEHTVFSLTTSDLFEDLFSVLNYIDEPFADSSALPVHILSKYTRKHVTVALSGDGADELFGGYMKHVGEYKIRNAGVTEKTIAALDFLWKKLPASRNNKSGNTIRRLRKLSAGLQLNVNDRYWKFASIGSDKYVHRLLKDNWNLNFNDENEMKQNNLISFQSSRDMNEVLFADMQLVLTNDMLVKVDRMSMANSLEVRTPFLDVTVVDYAFSLPADFKIEESHRKKIVQDAFRNILPPELYNRPKQGFEVPLLKWFRTELSKLINDLTEKNFIEQQGIFNYTEIENLKKQLHSNDIDDSVAKLWAIIVFQYWWKKYMN